MTVLSALRDVCLKAAALAAILLAGTSPTHALSADPAQESAVPPRSSIAASEGVPLVIGNRTLHVFRGTLGALTPVERAEAARRRLDAVLAAEGEGWTSVLPDGDGALVAIDGKPVFAVVPGDVLPGSGQTPQGLGNEASRVLQKVWSEARERGDPEARIAALLRTGAALLALALALAALTLLSRWLRRSVGTRLAASIGRFSRNGVVSHFSDTLIDLGAKCYALVHWLLALLVIFLFTAYALGQFALTRPFSETFVGAFQGMLFRMLSSAAAAVPGLFIAIFIFLLARVATRLSRLTFARIADGHLHFGAIDAHTAPATRQLVNGGIWLFALAMAYPYLPGAHTEAFKGVSVLLGVMVSIGASGVVGQIASGLILIYTRSLHIGEYVRIHDSEGTVTDIGLCVTRLRTGTGEEIALPNSLAISNVTRNFSSNVEGGGFIVDATVTIGYDAPWRQVHALLLEAARAVPQIRQDPPPYVIQTALSDFYVAYRLVAKTDGAGTTPRPLVIGILNAAIQDAFNRAGVQIMSPHYRGDPAVPKLVPEARWYAGPASGTHGNPATNSYEPREEKP